MPVIGFTQKSSTTSEKSVPVLVDFWAAWCGPCKMIAPVLSELADEYAGRVKIGKVNIDEEQELAMYELAIATLTEAGYRQYEISNFAKPGRECAHNIAYWEGEDYIGVGPIFPTGTKPGRPAVGLELIRQAIRQEPTWLPHWYRLCYLLMDQELWLEALEAASPAANS